MKKIIVAFFVAFIMLMIPVTVNSVTIEMKNKSGIDNEENEVEPQMYITTSQRGELILFIDINFEGEDKVEANAILDDILTYDSEYEVYDVEVDPLVDAVEEYSYYHIIPQEDIDNAGSITELRQLIIDFWTFVQYPFAELIEKIIDIIKDRVGWLYELFSEGGALFIQGVDLAKNFILNIQNLNIAKLFASAINLLVSIPILYFSESIKTLFNLDVDGFIDTIEEFTGAFTTNLSTLITDVEEFLILFGETFQPLINYLSDIGDFVDWLTIEPYPWQQEIQVSGSVNYLLGGDPLSGVQVSCRGETVTTGSNGGFSFNVAPSDTSQDSIPKENWYGLHSCIISVSRNGEQIKQTPKILSYVCSGGKIEWPFLVVKSRSVEKNYFSLLQERINNFLLKIQSFFPLFSTNLKIDAY